MKAVHLLTLSLVYVAIGVRADRSLLAGSSDKYGIVSAINVGNGSAIVTGFVTAGQAVDAPNVVTALAQLFGNRTSTD